MVDIIEKSKTKIEMRVYSANASDAELAAQEHCDNEEDDEYMVIDPAVKISTNVYKVIAKNIS
jgi:hypothetical protein